jgi:hypothetical protein
MTDFCRAAGDNSEGKFSERAGRLKASFSKTFFDSHKGLYLDGLNTPEEEGASRPANTSKRYFSQQANTLAVLYDLCDSAQGVEIMEKVISDNTLIQAQPYFMHYVLEAVYKTGLFEKYGLEQIRRWTRLVNECDKGLKEIWTGFDCDYSHAWGATPTYQLPSKLLGLKIIEKGFKKITLSPNLYGLDYAEIKVPTPFGYIKANLYKSGKNEFEIPEQIEYIILSNDLKDSYVKVNQYNKYLRAE